MATWTNPNKNERRLCFKRLCNLEVKNKCKILSDLCVSVEAQTKITKGASYHLKKKYLRLLFLLIITSLMVRFFTPQQLCLYFSVPPEEETSCDKRSLSRKATRTSQLPQTILRTGQ